MNYFNAITSIVTAHQASQQRTGRTSVRIYHAWIRKFSDHFISYRCNWNNRGVYSQNIASAAFYVGKTHQSIRSRINGHVRAFLKSVISYVLTGRVYMNPYTFARWCNAFANNQRVEVTQLSSDCRHESRCIRSLSKTSRLTNIAELADGYHHDHELVLSPLVRALVARARR